MLERWLEARDAAAVRSAWTALSPRKHVVTHPYSHRKLTLHGAAQLAGAMLGERADWIIDIGQRTPEFQVERVVDTCFVDGDWDISSECRETWNLHEQRDGSRGVQLLSVGARATSGPPEGGGINFVRVFDRDRAASVVIDSNTVSTIGEVDLSPLDLFEYSNHFDVPWSESTVEMMRGLVAQVAAEVDAHYDTSTLWPPVTGRSISEYLRPAPSVVQTFGEGDRVVTVVDQQGPYGKMLAMVDGLAWGHMLNLTVNKQGSSSRGYLWVRLPGVDLDRVMARLGIPKLY